MTPDEAPAIRRLRTWLAGNGYWVEDHQASDGDSVTVYSRGREKVQVSVDRRSWAVQLAPAGSLEYFNTAVWVACLTGEAVVIEADTVDEQVDWLISALTDAQQLELVDRNCLLRYRHIRAYTRIGLPLESKRPGER